MTVTIVGTLEMIYTSGADTISEPLNIDVVSPTEQPLALDTGLVFTDPAVDVRDTLEAYLAATYSLTSITRVGSPRAGALAEWTAVTAGSIACEIVLWNGTPLQQVGVDLGQTVVGDTGTTGRGYQSIEIGAGAEAAAKDSVAIGTNTTVAETATDALVFGTDATATGVSSVAMGTRATATAENALAVGTDTSAGASSAALGNLSHADFPFSSALGHNAQANASQATAVGASAAVTSSQASAVGYAAAASGLYSTAVGAGSGAVGVGAISVGVGANASGDNSIAVGRDSVVPATSTQSWVMGSSAAVPESTPERGVLSGRRVDVARRSADIVGATELALQDATGTLHTLGMDATNGLTYDTVPVKPPLPKRGVQSLANTVSAAGDIDFTNTVNPLGTVPGSKVTGLKPSTVYQVTITAMIALNTASAGTWRIATKFPTGGTEALSGFILAAGTSTGLDTWQWTGELTSNASGEISAHPSIRWVSGSVTSSRAEIIVRVEPT